MSTVHWRPRCSAGLAARSMPSARCPRQAELLAACSPSLAASSASQVRPLHRWPGVWSRRLVRSPVALGPSAALGRGGRSTTGFGGRWFGVAHLLRSRRLLVVRRGCRQTRRCQSDGHAERRTDHQDAGDTRARQVHFVPSNFRGGSTHRELPAGRPSAGRLGGSYRRPMTITTLWSRYLGNGTFASARSGTKVLATPTPRSTITTRWRGRAQSPSHLSSNRIGGRPTRCAYASAHLGYRWSSGGVRHHNTRQGFGRPQRAGPNRSPLGAHRRHRQRPLRPRHPAVLGRRRTTTRPRRRTRHPATRRHPGARRRPRPGSRSAS